MKNECKLICNKPNFVKIITKSILLFLFILPISVFAQKLVVVTGSVKDATGSPLSGVTIKSKTTNKTVISNNEGYFSIQVSEKNSVLTFSSIGFEDQVVTVGSKTLINVVLNSNSSSLNDVVVIGYGSAKRKDLISSVSKAPIEDMKKAPVPSFDAMLAGRVAGVNIVSSDGQPGAAATINIRGTSVSQETSPLYVIDGFPMENIDMNSINPNNIESLEVLKDPSSVAIYGSRGSNGVILITTKRGKKGAPVVSYNFSYGVQNDVNRVKMMNPYEFVKLQLELDSINSTPSVPSTRFAQIYLDPTKGIDLNYYKNVKGFDWQDLVLQQGIVKNHSINVFGGSEDTRYSFSGGNYDQTGLIVNSGMKRYDGQITLDQKINSHLKTGVSASYSNTESYGTVAAGSATGGVVQGMWQYRPVSGVNSLDLNNLVDSIAMQDFFNGTTSTLGDNLVNPLQQAQNELRKTITRTSYVNTYLEYSFLKNFKLKTVGGYNSTGVELDQFFNSKTQQGNLFKNVSGAIANSNGINGIVSNSSVQSYTSSNTLMYNNTFNSKHKLDAVLGFEYNYAEQQSTKFASINIPQATEYLGLLSMGSGTPSAATLLGGTRNQSYSYFSRANYNFSDKYYFMMAMRMDGSSRFAPGHQWGYFPSVGSAWTISEEKFFKPLLPVINYAKFRVTYGTTGNNKVGDFSYLSQYGSVTNTQGYTWNNTNIGGITPYFYGNTNLTWETTKGVDYGLNIELFKSRVSAEIVYYTKNTTNFLLGVRLPYSAGYPAQSQYQNTGDLSNNGLELTINTVNIQKKNFSWTSSFNIAFNNSKINQFYNGLESIQTAWNLYGSATAWVTKVGGPISQFYGYQWGGVYQYTDFDKLANGTYVLKAKVPTYSANVQPGDPKYKDINGDGVVDANDQTTLGSPLPIHTGGFTNNFTYKNWFLNVFMQWSYGNQIMNANRIVFESTGGYALNYNQFASYANRWTPSNPTNDIPRARYNVKGDVGSTNPRPSSRIIEDGSFLRLKTVSFGYDLPTSILKNLKIQKIRLNFAAQNLLVWTKYTGTDPEVNTFRSNNPANTPFGGTAVGSTSVSGAGYTFIQPSSGYAALAGGYDYTPYPRATTYTFGINVTF
jgi:TonB-linked SusC/RagA family outer membrane protein